MTRDEEQTLVRKAQKDPETFGRLYDEYYPRILGFILRRTADAHLARELTSNVFFRAMKNLWKFKWRNISLAAWFYRIAVNEVNRHYRDRKNGATSLDRMRDRCGFDPAGTRRTDDDILRAEEELQTHREYLRVQRALEELPPHYREVIALKYFERLKIREICELTGKKEGTVKSLLSRGIVMLREQCEK